MVSGKLIARVGILAIVAAATCSEMKGGST
jgi:hypothetical protein